MSQELALTTPEPDEDQGGLIQIIQLPIIKERLHFLKEFVDQRVAEAMAMVCTEDTVIDVKATRAELTALFEEAEKQRKAVKQAVMNPYLDFEAVYKECISEPFKKADLDLRRKINDVENTMKGAWEEKLRAFFDELTQAQGLNFLKYEQAGITVSMADARAKTQPPKKLRDQLERFVTRVGQDVDMIRNLESYSDEIMAVYKHTLCATDAIQSVHERHRQIEQARAEQERRNAVKAQEAEARQKVEAFAPPIADNTAAVAYEMSPTEDLLSCTFTVTDTLDRLRLLKQFLDANGYKYTT